MVNPELSATVPGERVFFVLAAWSAPREFGAAHATDEAGGQVLRFLSDLTCACLPLPLCSATSQRMFEAYRHWCKLQAVRKPTDMNRFVAAALANGFVRGRHRVRQHPSNQVAQHIVLHPTRYGVQKSGVQLDTAVSAFALALSRWRQATEQPTAGPPKART